MSYTYTAHADGNDTKRSNSYEAAADKAFAMCRKYRCEVTISHCKMGVMERFRFVDGEVVPC